MLKFAFAAVLATLALPALAATGSFREPTFSSNTTRSPSMPSETKSGNVSVGRGTEIGVQSTTTYDRPNTSGGDYRPGSQNGSATYDSYGLTFKKTF